MLCGSFDQACWPQAFVVRAFKPAVCVHSHLSLGCSSLPFASLQTLKCFAAASTKHSGPAAPRHSSQRHLLSGHSSLPFARLRPGTHSHLQTPTTLRGSFDQALHSHLLLGRSSLTFASLQTPKMLRGSFDQACWPQAFVVRAFKPAVCVHSHLSLGCSSLPFAGLQTLQMLRGSFDQALWPQGFVAVRAFKPAVYLQSHLLLEHSSLPFASLQTLKCFAAASTKHSGPAAPRHSSQRHLLSGHSSLPFARLRPGTHSHLQTPTTLRGSFDQALHSHLLLGRSSLTFASLQTPKMLRGSFDQALWPQASCC